MTVYLIYMEGGMEEWKLNKKEIIYTKNGKRDYRIFKDIFQHITVEEGNVSKYVLKCIVKNCQFVLIKPYTVMFSNWFTLSTQNFLCNKRVLL